MEWLMYLAVALCVTVLIAGTGWTALFAVGFSARSALLLAPPVGLGVLGFVTLISGAVGWFWAWWQPLLALVILLAFAVWSGTRRRRGVAKQVGPGIGAQTLVFGAAGVLVFALVSGLMLVVVAGSPSAVQSYGDSQFHYNGIRLIVDGASTSPFGGLGALYDPGTEGAQNYYPTLWHSLVALFATPDQIVLASNAVVLAVTTVFWPWSLVALAVTVAPRMHQLVAFVAPILGLLVSVFPAGIVYMIAIHPLGLALSFFPGAVALVLLCVDSPRTGRLYVIAAVGAIGMFCAHPSVGLLLFIVVGVAALSGEVVWLRSLWRGGRRVLALGAVTFSLAVVAGALAILLVSQFARNLASFSAGSSSYIEVVAKLLTGSIATTGGSTSVFPTLLWTMIFALAVFGVWVLRRSMSTWVLVVSGVGYTLLYTIAGGPENFLRALAGPWWKDSSRLVVPVLVVTISMASTGFSYFLSWLLRIAGGQTWPWLVVSIGAFIVIVPSAFLDLKTIGHDIRLGYSLSENAPTVLTDTKVAVLEAADAEFGKGELLVGPYSSGVGFVGVYSEAGSFFPKPRYDTAEQALLAKSFDSILEDPEVCEVLDRHNITGFMVDSPQEDHVDLAFAGFYNTNPTEGFELVTSVDGVSLYRITACE